MAEQPAVLELLRAGTLEVTGRITGASNTTLLCSVELGGVEAHCVYKPVRGERPLWDFPDGTLAGREVGSYLVSAATGWAVIPPTVLRDGPFGTGMVQLWVDTPGAVLSGAEVPDEADELIDLCSADEVPPGWRSVLRAHDYGGDVVVLAHADDPRLRRMAVLDIVINNADRKGGHILHSLDGHIYGVDHGICLHAENKLRTVLWGWVGERLGEEEIDVLSRLAAQLEGSLGQELCVHLTLREVDAVRRRVRRLLAKPSMPGPRGERMIPWPAFLNLDTRRCTQADLSMLQARWPTPGTDVHVHHYEQQATGACTYLVAWDGAEPLASTVIQWTGCVGHGARLAFPDAVEINHLQVRARFRANGVGTALIRRAEFTIAERQGREVAVAVGLENVRARALYERLGYVPTAVRDATTYEYFDDNGVAHQATEHDELLIKVL